MNIVALTFILILNLIIFLMVFKKKITSISLWITGMFTLASGAYLLNYEYFGNDISVATVFVVEGSIFCYFLGEIVGERIKIHSLRIKNAEMRTRDFIVSKNFIWVCTSFILLLTVYKIYDMYKFATSKGNTNIITLISFMRRYIEQGQYGNGTVVSLLTSFAEAVAYVFIFYFVYSIVYKKIKNISLLIPVIAYCMLLITATGRTGFLKIFIVVLGIIYAVMKSNSKGKFNIEKRYVKYIFIIGVTMIAVFYLYGLVFRGSTRTIMEYSANYFSAGLYGLDTYIRDPWEKNEFVGKYTFANYYYYINAILDTNFEIPEHNLPFFSWINSRSNIYTGLLLPLQDFGVIGLFITRFIVAILYSSLERYVLNRSEIERNVLAVVIFGYFLYVNFSIPIADRFKEFLTVTTFPSLVVFIVFVNYLYRKNCKKRIGS